jgi:predicted TPR repeat methyltransferase
MNSSQSSVAAPPVAAPGEVTISLGEALRLGVQAHQNGDLASAEGIYREILRVKPGQQEALHYLGLLAFHVGQPEVAADLISEACKSDPGYAAAFNNLGNVLMHLGDVELAEKVYRRALELQDNLYDALVNLTVLNNLQGRHEEALETANRALKVMPELGVDHREELEGYLATAPAPEASTRAMAVLSRATLKPTLLHSLGHSLARLGRSEDAQRIYRQWASLDPRDPRPTHYLAALNQSEVPPQASPEYVRLTFDRFASSFDRVLTRLKYSVPELLRDALVAERKDRGACGELLDAGCGTGWCGPLLRPWAQRLVGVDLSPRMLDKARDRNCYDELVEGDLVAHLHNHPDRYDVISAADVLEYFGDLQSPFAGAGVGLKPGGWLMFTVEKTVPEEAPEGYRLELHGRYSHTAPYLRQVLEQQGLMMEECREVFLRTEGGRDVQGWLVTARRPARSKTSLDAQA